MLVRSPYCILSYLLNTICVYCGLTSLKKISNSKFHNRKIIIKESLRYKLRNNNFKIQILTPDIFFI